MGASSRIREWLANLPIDETWVLVGMAILAVAAISHLYTMWRNARHGMSKTSGSSRTEPASRYFEAWETAAASEGLRTEVTDGPLEAPSLRGRLRKIPANVEMQLRRGGRRTPDPEAIHPATVHCRITARIELPFPWRDVTIRQFILPESVQKGDDDEVDFAFDLPDGARVRGVRIDRRARASIAEMSERFQTTKVVDGTLTVVDEVQPSRNTARWADRFGEWLRDLGASSRAFADGGVRMDIELSRPNLGMTLVLEPDPALPRRKCRVHLEAQGTELLVEEVFRDRLRRMGATVEKLETVDDGLRARIVVDRDDEEIVRRFVSLVGR